MTRKQERARFAAFPLPDGDNATRQLLDSVEGVVGAKRSWRDLCVAFHTFFYGNSCKSRLDREEPFIAELIYISALAHYAAACKAHRQLRGMLDTPNGFDILMWADVQVPFVTLVMRLFSSIDLLSHLYECVCLSIQGDKWERLRRPGSFEDIARKSKLNIKLGNCALGRELCDLKTELRDQVTHRAHFYIIPKNGRAFMLHKDVPPSDIVGYRWQSQHQGTMKSWLHVPDKHLYPSSKPLSIDEISGELLEAGIKAVHKVKELVSDARAAYPE